MNFTVSMKGMETSFHWRPWRKPPIQSETKKDSPPTSHSQNEVLARVSEWSFVFSIRGTA